MIPLCRVSLSLTPVSGILTNIWDLLLPASPTPIWFSGFKRVLYNCPWDFHSSQWQSLYWYWHWHSWLLYTHKQWWPIWSRKIVRGHYFHDTNWFQKCNKEKIYLRIKEILCLSKNCWKKWAALYTFIHIYNSFIYSYCFFIHVDLKDYRWCK